MGTPGGMGTPMETAGTPAATGGVGEVGGEPSVPWHVRDAEVTRDGEPFGFLETFDVDAGTCCLLPWVASRC